MSEDLKDSRHKAAWVSKIMASVVAKRFNSAKRKRLSSSDSHISDAVAENDRLRLSVCSVDTNASSDYDGYIWEGKGSTDTEVKVGEVTEGHVCGVDKFTEGHVRDAVDHYQVYNSSIS